MSQRNQNGARRKLTPEQKRRILERRRRQRQRKQRMLICAALAAVLIVALTVALALRARGAKDGAESVPEATQTAQAQPSETPEPSATPAPVVEDFSFDEAYIAAVQGEETGPLIEVDKSKIDPSLLTRWPKVQQGYIPVTYGANNVTEKLVAITVDDCFQGENLRQIVQCALDNGGKLTIFPIGDNLKLESVSSAVKWAWEQGMELENHTFDHVGNYHYDDAGMESQIWTQSQMLNEVLGVNYQQHFFRPKGGDEFLDQRTHAYVSQLGMYAIARWGASGTSNLETVIGNLKPGQVYLFHTTDKDMKKLLYFIPYLVQQGYKLVTLNELFGLPENEVSALTPPSDPPALQPFRIEPASISKTSYMRAAAVVQQRLIELGYLTGEADGVFGESSYIATGYFQLAAGLKADGIAGVETQRALFAEDAPPATDEMKAKIKAGKK